MQNFKHNMTLEKLPRISYVSSCWIGDPPPVMVHLPLKWRNEDPAAFKDAFAPFGLSQKWKNATSICFTDLLAHRLVIMTPKVRRFCAFLYVEDRGMKMRMITWGVRTWPDPKAFTLITVETSLRSMNPPALQKTIVNEKAKQRLNFNPYSHAVLILFLNGVLLN